MSDKTILGLDIGGGALKLFGTAGGVELPAHVAVARARYQTTRATGLRSLRPPPRVLTDASGFYVGLGAHDWGRPVENLGDERFAGSPEVRALFYAALARYMDQAGAIGDLDLVVGLTQSSFRADVGADARPWLVGEHAWQIETGSKRLRRSNYHAKVEQVAITSQAGGALFDYLLDDRGDFVPARKAAFKREIGIVSIGMNTLELLVLRNGAVVERFSDSRTAGVRRLLEIVDPSSLYSRGELDTWLRRGRLDYKGSLPVWGAEVYGHVERRWGAAFRRFAVVLVVGGGVVLLSHDLTARFNGKAYVPDEPVLSVARGLYKMGLQRAARTRGQ